MNAHTAHAGTNDSEISVRYVCAHKLESAYVLRKKKLSFAIICLNEQSSGRVIEDNSRTFRDE